MTTAQPMFAPGQLTPLPLATEREGAEIWAGEWVASDAQDHTSADHVNEDQMTWQALPPLSMWTTYLLLVLLGPFGAHQFYLRKPWRGGLCALTAGGLGIGLAIDLFTIPRQVEAANALRALGLR